MNQRLTVFFLCNIALFLVLLLISTGIRCPVLNRFALLEQSMMQQQLSRIASGLTGELERLDAKARSEATWGEMYTYMVERNSYFYSDNFTYAGLSPAHINVFGILDKKGNPIHLDWLNSNTHQLESLISNQRVNLLSNKTLQLLVNTHGTTLSNSRNMGFVMTPRGVLLVATRPILTSNAYGPPHGAVLVGRILNKSLLKLFERHSNLKLKLLNFTDIQLSQIITQVTTSQTVSVINHKSIEGYINLVDIEGKNVQLVSAIAPRLQYIEAEEVLNQFTLILFITGLLFGIIISILLDNVITYHQQLNQINQELTRLANIDGLTLLANRRSFENHFQQEWMRAMQGQYPLTLLLCDVDYFKAYNDTYGHQAGDECLRKLACVINCAATGSDDLAARYGGEEFAVILPNKNIALCIDVAENMLRNVQKLQIQHTQSSISPYVSLSIGVASVIPTPEILPATLIEQSDLALYSAKSQGRNQIVCL